jgi:hypothetical protein
MAEKISDLKNISVCKDSSDDEQNDDAGDDCGLSLEKLNLGPRKKLLILGLGGLLCHRVHRRDWSRARYGNHDSSYGSIFGRNSSLYLNV